MNYPKMINEPMELLGYIAPWAAGCLVIGVIIGIAIGVNTKKLPRHAKIAIETVSSLKTVIKTLADDLGRERARVADYKAGIQSNMIMKAEINAFMEKIV